MTQTIQPTEQQRAALESLMHRHGGECIGIHDMDGITRFIKTNVRGMQYEYYILRTGTAYLTKINDKHITAYRYLRMTA